MYSMEPPQTLMNLFLPSRKMLAGKLKAFTLNLPKKMQNCGLGKEGLAEAELVNLGLLKHTLISKIQ